MVRPKKLVLAINRVSSLFKLILDAVYYTPVFLIVTLSLLFANFIPSNFVPKDVFRYIYYYMLIGFFLKFRSVISFYNKLKWKVLIFLFLSILVILFDIFSKNKEGYENLNIHAAIAEQALVLILLFYVAMIFLRTFKRLLLIVANRRPVSQNQGRVGVVSISVFLVLFGILVGYSFRPQAGNVPEVPQIEQETSTKPYYTDVPANYFDTTSTMEFKGDGILIGDDRFTVRTAPKLINIDPSTIDVVSIDLPFKLSLLKKTLKGEPFGSVGMRRVGNDATYYEDKYDLDGDGNAESYGIRILKEADVNSDGEKEMIVVADIAPVHAVRFGVIVNQEGKIIFTSEYFPNFSIWAAEDGNGFYTAEKLTTVGLFGVGGFRTTRYLHQDGKFIPVWTQDEYDPIVKR